MSSKSRKREIRKLKKQGVPIVPKKVMGTKPSPGLSALLGLGIMSGVVHDSKKIGGAIVLAIVLAFLGHSQSASAFEMRPEIRQESNIDDIIVKLSREERIPVVRTSPPPAWPWFFYGATECPHLFNPESLRIVFYWEYAVWRFFPENWASKKDYWNGIALKFVVRACWRSVKR